MDGLEKCRVIARYAIGLDTVDLAAAKERGIMVANCTDYCLDEVADSTAAHILNAARRISVSRDRLMDGNFEMNGLAPNAAAGKQHDLLCWFWKHCPEPIP